MKKVLFAAFAGMCVFSSIMATSAHTGKLISSRPINQVLRDTVPPEDTTKKKVDISFLSDTVPDKKDTTKKIADATTMPRVVDLSMR